MTYRKPILISSLLLSAAAFNAQASLTSYTANGVDFVSMESSGFDLSFTKDGNLFKTIANSYVGGASAFVNAVITASAGKIIDTPNSNDTPVNSGYHNLASSDFNVTTGKLNWFGSKAFVNYLNNINYGGSNQWALPSLTDTGTPGCNFAYNGSDCGYNVNTNTSPLAKLFYGELSKKAYYRTNGTGPQSGYGIFGNNGQQLIGGSVAQFTNVLSSVYWLDTEYAQYPNYAWGFSTFNGYQLNANKLNQNYAWVVTPGRVKVGVAQLPVIPVPLPSAVWLLMSGLFGFLCSKRRRQVW